MFIQCTHLQQVGHSIQLAHLHLALRDHQYYCQPRFRRKGGRVQTIIKILTFISQYQSCTVKSRNFPERGRRWRRRFHNLKNRNFEWSLTGLQCKERNVLDEWHLGHATPREVWLQVHNKLKMRGENENSSLLSSAMTTRKQNSFSPTFCVKTGPPIFDNKGDGCWDNGNARNLVEESNMLHVTFSERGWSSHRPG